MMAKPYLFSVDTNKVVSVTNRSQIYVRGNNLFYLYKKGGKNDDSRNLWYLK